ncbi:tyrosine decarboxylase, partial [Brachionus plicatilis]
SLKKKFNMNADQFRQRGKELIDYIADYLENMEIHRVTPNVEPGYLKPLLPKDAPHQSEEWETIFQDFKEKILPGVTHWQHPRFHAYFPAGNSYPSILGELLSAGLGTVGFSWAASPSCTELETIVLDWLGRMLNLPKSLLPEPSAKQDFTQTDINGNSFAHNLNGQSATQNSQLKGGGVILGSASECVLVSLLSARNCTLRKLKSEHPFVEDGHLLSKLVMYTSKLAHSCVEKAGMIAMVKIRILEPDDNYSLRGDTLDKAISSDISNGLVPFFVSCTLGTTSCCSFDNLVEIGPICGREDIYLHVDAAYAGSALVCEELRFFSNGLEVKDKFKLTEALSVDPIYLRYKEMDKAIDYRHWGIALSRRFRSLKIWFTLRSYGVEGIQKYIREHVRLAKFFEKLILSDDRFEILGKVTLGLVCFRLKGPNFLSQNLLFELNDSGLIHMVPSMLGHKYVIRLCVNSERATENDMGEAWKIIRLFADSVIEKYELENGKLFSKECSQSALKLKRMRFSLSKMASDPKSYNQKKFMRTPTIFDVTGKYLAKKCSFVQDDEEES